MSKRSSTKNWLQRQSNDPFVKRRIKQGLRSRAVFKLDELLSKQRIVKAGSKVVDLGAAPGGWSERVKDIVGPAGAVVAVDLLEIEPIDGVLMVKGDICKPEVISQVTDIIGGNCADLVLSDIAPNITGIRDADEANFLEVADAVLEVASYVLKPEGVLILKMFQFPGTDAFIKGLKQRFAKVSRKKPAASRKQSKEFYVVASGFKL
ncbi:MAG: RlmE family RNA methyltransferase [Gammaproteobacteria bacterium]